MEDKISKSRAIAGEALTDLTTPGVSIEVPIRKALRVAALRRHAFWQAWLQLQLIDITQAKGDLRAMKDLLQGYFPENDEYQRVAKDVFSDYMASRSSEKLAGQMWGAPIRSLEMIAENAEMFFQAPPGTVTKEWLAIAQESRPMILRIKNRLQNYLMKIESEDGPAER